MTTTAPSPSDERLAAAVLLIGHTGATTFEAGYLHDDVPTAEASWWATATYRGAKISVEKQAGPIEAAEALALRLLTGARCRWCGGISTVSPDGAIAYPGSTLTDGSKLPESREGLEALGQCLWGRVGARWEPGCIHGASTAPDAPKDRAARRRLAREFGRTRT